MARSIVYLFWGSGVVSTLYKIKEIWGDDALIAMIEYMADYVQEWTPNSDCRFWLKHNKAEYRESNPDFMDFLNTSLAGSLA